MPSQPRSCALNTIPQLLKFESPGSKRQQRAEAQSPLDCVKTLLFSFPASAYNTDTLHVIERCLSDMSGQKETSTTVLVTVLQLLEVYYASRIGSEQASAGVS